MSSTTAPTNLASDLEEWVGWYVGAYEAWDRIPVCWPQHQAMVNELQAAMDLRKVLDAGSADDVLAAGKTRSEWHDYRGRMMDRLALTPGATCAAKASHREPASWDREGSAERRRQARLALRQTTAPLRGVGQPAP